MRAGSDSDPRAVPAALLVVVGLSASLLGCGEGGRTAVEAGLPPGELSGRFPPGATLLHAERFETPISYTLWIYHDPDADTLIDFSGMPGDPDGHELPGAILSRVVEAKVPRFEVGDPEGGTCRYTHWTSEGVEYQARELVSDRGWIASVEELRPAGEPGGPQAP